MGEKHQGVEMLASKPLRFIYKAFISYSHAADGMLAPKLQSGLHQFAKPWYRLRAMRVFRDETSLSNTPELWPSIEAALSQSEYFLLLASPESRQITMGEEGDRVLGDHRSKDKLLIILTNGCLKWDSKAKGFDWTGTTALPEDVKYLFEDEPRYTDLREVKSTGQLSVRNPTFRATVADVASTLLGHSKDELIGEDVRRHRQTKRIAWAAVIMLLVLTVASIVAAYVAVQNQKEAKWRQHLAESRRFAAESERRRDANDIELTLLLAAEAVDTHDTFEARRALFEALKSDPYLHAVLPPDMGFSASGQGLAFSPDGSRLAATGNRYPVVLWDVQERRSLAPPLTGEIRNVLTVDFSPDGQRVAAGDEEGVVLVWDVNSQQQVGRPLTHR